MGKYSTDNDEFKMIIMLKWRNFWDNKSKYMYIHL